MLRNYLVVAFRRLLKNRTYSLVNILGLTMAMTASFLIFRYVNFELSYDKFHQHSDRIYRVALDKYQGENERLKIATNFNALPKAIEDNVPTVEAVAEAHRPTGTWIFTRKESEYTRQFQEEDPLYADEHFVDMFAYEWLAGDPTQALVAPYSIVLTAAVAAKYFGTNASPEDILGKSLQISVFSDDTDYTVTGIIEDIPPNSHLLFTSLLSISTFGAMYPEENFEEDWEWYDSYVYIRLQASSSHKQVASAIQALLEKNSEAMGEGSVATSKIFLQPVEDIHLHSHLKHEISANGSYYQVVFLVLVAVALLVVAGLNYINLYTAQSLKRLKEVGVRKYVGANQYQLGMLALTETWLVLLISLVLSVCLLLFTAPVINDWLGFSVNIFLFSSYSAVSVVVAVGVLLALISSYPAYFIAGFEAVKALKGVYTGKKGVQHLQKGLISVQLLIATLVIAFTFMLYQQYQFMQQQSLGFDDQVMIFIAPTAQTVRGTEAYAARVKTFKGQLLASSAISSVAASTHIPSKRLDYGTSKIYAEGKSEGQGINMNFIGIDADYIPTFGLKILAGENFPPEPRSETPYILNESAALALGFTNFEEAIGQHVIHHGKKHRIAAIINDYHQQSLREPILPLAFANIPYHHEFFAVKFTANSANETIRFISRTFENNFPDNPFTYYFMDDVFEQLHQADQRYSIFFTVFSSLIVLMACLGLFSVATYATQERTKEVGIRKVLGASVVSMVRLLIGDFLKLVLIVSVIALPLAYWAMQHWLESYAFRIEISIWLLLIPVIVVFGITLITVGMQTVKAALANPIQAIRYE